ncbi:MAG: gamma-glutamylcyclotransferase [Pseudaminobacter sp.]|nr:gamma-glutamylcyclotransferase [Pseudaminobacter sp.]
MSPREMSLTPELVERCRRAVEDSGPEQGLGYLDDADYEAMLDATLAEHPQGAPVWLFAYGSLIWKPELEHVDERIAVARGWHRSFCIKMTRWRGTLDRPGLMMGLDRGGQCKGVAYRLPDGNLRERFAKLFRREMTAKPATYKPKWLKLETAEGPIEALGFVVNRRGRTYAGKLDDHAVAGALAGACGHLGSGPDYLYNTVRNLEDRGIHDTHLWRLQHLVAQAVADRL